MNIFIRELKANRKSLIIWCVSIFLLIASGMGKYAALSTGEQSINEIIRQLPKVMQVLFGTNGYDLSKASGFYGIISGYLLLMAAIFASMLGANIIAKEERDKTAEFLLTKPVSRAKILGMKLGAVLVNILLFDLVSLLSSLLLIKEFGKGENVNQGILLVTLAMLILQLVFASIGACLAAALRRPKKAAAAASAIILLTYFLSIFIELNGDLKALRLFTPFQYFDLRTLLYSGSFNGGFMILSILITLIALSWAWLRYRERDMQI